MESPKMYSSSQCKKPRLPVRACKLPSLMWGSIGPRTEFSGSSDLPFTMVPCLHQSNVYIKRKLQVWRVQRCIPLVGAKTALTCAGRKTTPSDMRRFRLENVNSGLPFAMVPCLHHSNVYIKRNLRVWKIKKCIILVGVKTGLTCAGLQITPSHVRRYKAENRNLWNFGSTFHHGTVFAPNHCLYQKEAANIESPKMCSSSWCKKRT